MRCTLLLDVLVATPQGQHRVRAQIGLQHAVECGLLRGAQVGEIVAVFIGQHRTAAQLAVKGQRAGGIDFRAVVVPAAGAGRKLELGLGRRHLAHQVDGAARVARAIEQAGSAAQHLDPVELRHVVGDEGVVAAGGGHGRTAIDLHAVDRKAARVDVGQAVAAVLHRQAHDLLGRLAQVGDVLVFQPLLGQHRHRLRHLAHGLCGLAEGDAIAGVGARALGLAQAPGLDPHFAQGDDLILAGQLCLLDGEQPRAALRGHHAAACQQPLQRIAGRIAALQRWGLQACQLVLVKQQLLLGLGRKGAQCGGQGLGGNAEGHARLLLAGLLRLGMAHGGLGHCQQCSCHQGRCGAEPCGLCHRRSAGIRFGPRAARHRAAPFSCSHLNSCYVVDAHRPLPARQRSADEQDGGGRWRPGRCTTQRDARPGALPLAFANAVLRACCCACVRTVGWIGEGMALRPAGWQSRDTKHSHFLQLKNVGHGQSQNPR